MSNLDQTTRANTLAVLGDPAKVAALKASILANVQERQAEKAQAADVTTKPTKATKKAPKAAVKAPSKKVAPVTAKPAAVPKAAGKVLASRPDTDLICVTDTGTGASLSGVGYELSPMEYNGAWVWSVPGMAEKEVRGNALLRHPGYVRAGRFFAVVRNRQDELEAAVRTRIRSKAAGAATAERRTEANLTAYRAWVSENAEARPA